MNAWTQKKLDTLASAIDNHLSVNPWSERHGYLLIDARKRAHSASQVPYPNEKPLNEIRLAVCQVCRQYQLYECDFSVGWSENCAFLKKNT